MSMFEELFGLARHGTLTLIVDADTTSGRMTVLVIPSPKDDHGEAALRQPLSLTATPQEFDGGFVSALRGYREVHLSLAEQAAATHEVLEAAKSASVKKASEATRKAAGNAGKPTPSPAATRAVPSGPQHDSAVEVPNEAAADADTVTPMATDLFV